jgi:phytoene dehydrogenase-like protein
MTVPHFIKDHPIVIIGGGIGGLSTAIILAKLGYPAILIERNHHPGGMMRSYPRGGIDCDVGVHYLGALDKGQVLRRCFDFLGVAPHIPLTRMGASGIIDRYLFEKPFGGPSMFDLPTGFDAYEDNLKNAFPKESTQIESFMDLLRRSAQQLNDLDFLYSDHPSEFFIEQAEPLGNIFRRLNFSRALRTVIGVPACWVGIPADRCPVFYHNMTVASYLFSAWRLVHSGRQMADAFSQRFRALGGEILTGRAVRRVLVQDGHISGVKMDDGQSLPASCVFSTVHPKVLIAMLDENSIKPSYRNRIRRLKDTPGFFCVHARVDSAKQKEIPYNIFSIRADESGHIDDSLFIQLRASSKDGWHLLTVLGRGRYDMWRSWEKTWTGQRGTRYENKKKETAARLIESAEKIVGPLRSVALLDAYTPLTIRDWVNSPEGSAYGIMKSSDQILSAALLNRTSIKGLLLAGQSLVAPGVLGTILGSFASVKFLLGPKRFKQEVDL